VNIIEILEFAKEKEASDIHLIAGYSPSFRINGFIKRFDENFKELDGEIIEELAMGLIDEDAMQRLKEIKELDVSFEIENLGRYRINCHYQQKTIGIAIRLLNEKIPTLEELGIESTMSRFLEYENGLVLITGETGSGKSTTLAAIINEINMKDEKHIITLEDPIEYKYGKGSSVVEQREISVDSKSFASGLKYILRQDPDIILIGELRDAETISIALTAAETGHLVFATLHTNSAPKSIDRLIDSFAKERQEQVKAQLSTTLKAIVSQRLLPTKEKDARVLAQEIMLVTTAISNLIKEGDTRQINSTMSISSQDGNITMDSALQKLRLEGKI
jgi:twitching motility protein PilT